MRRIFTLLLTFAFGFSAIMAEGKPDIANNNAAVIYISEGTAITGVDFLFVKPTEEKKPHKKYIYVDDNAIITGQENIFVKDYSDTAKIETKTQSATKNTPAYPIKKVKTQTKQEKHQSKVFYNSTPIVPAHSIMAAYNRAAAIVPAANRLEHNALEVSLDFYNDYLFYLTQKPTAKERTNFYIADFTSNFGIRPPPFEA